ncbi:MAG: DUF4097 family beta strand repeat-containing protein [Candidatus Solibacter sp.]
MRAKLVVPAIAAGLFILAGCDFEDVGGLERYHEDFHYNYPLKTGGRLAVEGFNGSIEVTVWDQQTVDISGTKTGRNQEDTRDIKIDIDHTADSVSIRAVRPTMRHGNYSAKFAIKVPRGIVLDRLTTSNGAIRAYDCAGPARLKTSNGSIEVRNLKGPLNGETSNSSVDLSEVEGNVDVRSSNGHIRAAGIHGSLDATTSNSTIRAALDAVSGPVRVQSSNGSIDLTMPAGAQTALRAHTSNSSITLHLPGEVNARLSAVTSNASVTTDFEMRLRGDIGKHSIEGTLGSGGPLIDLSTSNGSIRILK